MAANLADSLFSSVFLCSGALKCQVDERCEDPTARERTMHGETGKAQQLCADDEGLQTGRKARHKEEGTISTAMRHDKRQSSGRGDGGLSSR